MADYFSKQSAVYARNRPSYPEELFIQLKDLCREHELAWDVATGNGQCAVPLSNYFKKVFATDLSEAQLANSFKKSNIDYKIELAEKSSLSDESTDLVTVATAIHWFDIPVFYSEVNRILKPGGILAVWGYGGCTISKEIDVLINHFSFETLKPYWPWQTRLNWEHKYETLPFPYPFISMPAYQAIAHQNLNEFFAYMNSWSAVQVYIKQHQQNPIELIRNELSNLWGDETTIRKISWDLFMKCGRKN